MKDTKDPDSFSWDDRTIPKINLSLKKYQKSDQ